jgi:hypothetical protein
VICTELRRSLTIRSVSWSVKGQSTSWLVNPAASNVRGRCLGTSDATKESPEGEIWAAISEGVEPSAVARSGTSKRRRNSGKSEGLFIDTYLE